MRNKLSALALASVVATGLVVGASGIAFAQGYQPSGDVYNQYQTYPQPYTGVPQAGYATQPTSDTPYGGRGTMIPPGGQYYSGGVTGSTQPPYGPPMYGPAPPPYGYPAPMYGGQPAWGGNAYYQPPGGQQYSGGVTGNTQPDVGYPGH
jgi:hypothetical protein